MTAGSESIPRGDSIPLFGALEGGGTKIVCAVGHSPDRVLERSTLPTRDPASTLQSAADFFGGAQLTHGKLAALGVAFFGPLELRRGLPGYGRLLDTPKPGWSGTDILTPLTHSVQAPIVLDTDVAAAALAEWRLGAARDAASLAYVTVGTGIGVGFAPDVLEQARLLHPEAGHLPVRRAPGDDFAGVCPFHGDCLEGLASGPAIRARWGGELRSLPGDHPAWAIIGTYLGQLAASIALLVPVERIVFGGGVMAGGGRAGDAALLAQIRIAVRRYLGAYLPTLNDTAALDRYIRVPALGEHAGIAGAFLLAADVWTRCRNGSDDPEPAQTE